MPTILALALSLAAGGTCLHGADETAEQAKRRRDAAQAVRYINTAESMGLEKAKRYVPLGQLTAIPAPAGFKLSLVNDNKSYLLAAKDTRDPCGFALFSDDSGLIYEAQPLRARAR